MSIKKDKNVLLWEDWEELLKSHKYSRKELINGVWRYYYDKNSNYSRMTRCKAKPLAVSEAMTAKQIVDIAHDYLKNVWIADWKQHPEKAIVKELHGKQVEFSHISYSHIGKTGRNSPQGGGARSKTSLLSHVKYLPLAKELLEENGVHTQSRYEKFEKKREDDAVGTVYQIVSGLAPEGDENNYIHATVSQRKYADGRLGDTVYISVLGTKNIKKSIPRISALALEMLDITEGNRQAKYDELSKCLFDGEAPRYIADDGTRRLGRAEITLKDLSYERINKALRTMAFTLDVPLKAGKGEAFSFKAQEDLADKWAGVFASLVRDTYDFITNYLSLPQVTVMSKANLVHKGKILYSPETGEPIKQADWNKFVKSLEEFLNRKTKDLGKRIVLEGEALGRILDRMLKYNTLEDVKRTRLEGLKFHGKTFDWIADDIKNLKDALGEPLTRTQAARVQVMQMSAAQRITKMTIEMKESAKQILIDGVRNRQGATQVSQALFEKFVGLNSNYQRIAETELQNAANNAIVHEETAKAKEGEKVYFQRVEIIDDNTCDYCKRMNGKIAVWSDTPLANERVKDEYAEFAIWEGKEWVSGQKNIAAVGCFHPYCRGIWTRWKPEGKAADAYTAEISRRGKKWKEAVETARKEFKAKGIENPDDRTAGYTERIEELFVEEIKKSFTEGEHPRDGAGRFTKKGEEGSSPKSARAKGVNAQAKQDRQERRLNLANACPHVITGISPLKLTGKYISQIRAEYKRLKKLALNGELFCNALKKPVTRLNTTHEYVTHSGMRTEDDMKRHAAYIPFIPAVLEHGIYDPKMDRDMADSGKSHEVVCRAEIVENGAPKRIGIAVILVENKGAVGLEKISVFRMNDENGVIKALHQHRVPCGSRKSNAVAMKYNALELHPTLPTLFGEKGEKSTDIVKKSADGNKDSAMSKICFVNKKPDIYSDLVAEAEAIRARTSRAVKRTAQDLLREIRELDGEEEPAGFFEKRRNI